MPVSTVRAATDGGNMPEEHDQQAGNHVEARDHRHQEQDENHIEINQRQPVEDLRVQPHHGRGHQRCRVEFGTAEQDGADLGRSLLYPGRRPERRAQGHFQRGRLPFRPAAQAAQVGEVAQDDRRIRAVHHLLIDFLHREIAHLHLLPYEIGGEAVAGGVPQQVAQPGRDAYAQPGRVGGRALHGHALEEDAVDLVAVLYDAGPVDDRGDPVDFGQARQRLRHVRGIVHGRVLPEDVHVRRRHADVAGQ